MSNPSEQSRSPAGRLLRFLQLAKNYGPDIQNRSALGGFASIFNTDPNDRGLVLYRVGLLLRLPGETKDAVQCLKNVKHSLYLGWYDQVIASFNDLNLQGPFQTFHHQVTPQSMQLLEICDDLLVQSSPDLIVETSTLEDLTKKIGQLKSDLTAHPDLDMAVRQFILKHIDIIERALIDYRLQGLPALRDGVIYSVGLASVDRGVYSRAVASPIGQSLMLTLTAWALMVQGVDGTLKLPETIREVFSANDVIAEPKTLPDANMAHVEESVVE